MDTNEHKLGFKKEGLVRFGLKGQCILAQPSGLGLEKTPNLVALKGQDKSRFYVALSERFISGNDEHPGQRPGLSYTAPLVRLDLESEA